MTPNPDRRPHQARYPAPPYPDQQREAPSRVAQFAEHPLGTQDVSSLLDAKLEEIASDPRSRCRAAVRPGRGLRRQQQGPWLGAPPGEKADCRDHVAAVSQPVQLRAGDPAALILFDFVNEAGAVGQLETDAIGGTWGKASSVLSEGWSSRTRS